MSNAQQICQAVQLHDSQDADESTLQDIVTMMEGISTREALVEFWHKRTRCDACRCTIVASASNFSYAIAGLYNRLTILETGYSVAWSDSVTDWATKAHARWQYGTSAVAPEPLTGTETLELVRELGTKMLDFNWNHEYQALAWNAVPDWIERGNWRGEWHGILENPKTVEAFRALAMDDTDFVNYFLGLAKDERMPDPENILHDSKLFAGMLDQDPDDLRTTMAGTHPVFAMAAELLLKFRYESEA